MTQHRLVFHPGVQADIEEIVAFYAERDPGLPARFRERLRGQVDVVLLFPTAGAVLFEEYRRVLLSRFPFMVVYLVSDQTVYVHVRRDPAVLESQVANRAESSSGNTRATAEPQTAARTQQGPTPNMASDLRLH